MIITLCGSKRFIEDFKRLSFKLTCMGHIVLMPAIFNHPDDIEISDEMHNMYDRIHHHKMEMSDEVYIVNKDHYIGKDTQEEIDYATSKGMIIKYMEE